MTWRALGLAAVVFSTLALVAWVAWRPTPHDPAVVETSGRVEGDQAAVGAKVGGRIVRLAVREGERVASGRTIAELGHGGLLSRDMAFRFPPYRANVARGELE